MRAVNCRPVAIDAGKVNFIEPPKAVKLSQSLQLLLKKLALTIMLVILAGQLSAYTV